VTLRLLDVSSPLWWSFVTDQRAALPFHQPSWTELLAECYGYRTFAAAVIGPDAEPTAGLPVAEIKSLVSRERRWISLPFTDFCPPLAAHGEGERQLAAELETARAAAGVQQVVVHADLASAGAQTTTSAVRHELQLEHDSEALFRRLSKSQVQRNVKRARREQVTVRRAERESDLDRVFFDLQLETRRRLGVPIQPRRFYTLLWRKMLESGHGFLLLAYHRGRPIAGTLFLRGNQTLIYKYSASLRSHWDLRPNALILWTAIEQACAAGLKVLDFGRTELQHEGLRRYKQNWSTSEIPLTHTVLGRPIQERRERTQALGERVIQRSPSWVCRAAGELLYKYAA
jgi:CelD/BcsL family acetyltransferase involved in cellulose biosynthesis